MLKLYEAARLRGVPILSVRTADQRAAQAALVASPVNGHTPAFQWDAVRGIASANRHGEALIAKAALPFKPEETVGFVEAMMAARLLPAKSVLYVHNAHRQLLSQEPASTANAVQAVANLRDEFKKDLRVLVLLASPAFQAPPELAHDIVPLHEALPGEADLRTVVQEVAASAKSTCRTFLEPKGDDLAHIIDAVTGLSTFAAEQQLSMSLTETGFDVPGLRERQCVAIEQTPGLNVYRGTETLADLRGLESVKARVAAHRTARTPPGVVVWIDEGADVFQNVEHDAGGNKTDQQRLLLMEMEQHDWRGFIFIGVPGSGKSAVARAMGNEFGVPTISVDFGGMESKWQGESEANARQAIDVIKSVGRGHAFFALTCNSLKGIRPQFQRRFRRGTFFFDLPTAEERQAIWALYMRRYELPLGQPLPEDEGWTGAEIRECCESAWDCGITLLQAAQFVVPVARSRASEINAMRSEAHGRFLDASHPGAFQYREDVMREHLRAVSLGSGTVR